ncbi:DUF3558 domain-containing protein [Rhodococcus sp. 14C212]|uniref:DUF3558 domain-containing protein n=1 Tax=Rhodococcus sp. 14C212 TaxID=2711209 RepID=UPI001980D26F|nr:DUF3558 domain-containing protein [Rhodococcus sp. 14C212]
MGTTLERTSPGRVVTARRTATTVTGTLVVLAALAGCASPTHSSTTVSSAVESPTAATRVPRLADESNRPVVAFDPCLDIPNDVIIAAGYDPATEDEADFAATHFTMLGCAYKGTVHIPGVLVRYDLSVLSANFNFEEEQQKSSDNGDDVRRTEIAGRRALLKTNQSLPERCEMSIETSYGILIVARIHWSDSGSPVPKSQWCTGLEDTVERIVAVLDDFEAHNR